MMQKLLAFLLLSISFSVASIKEITRLTYSITRNVPRSYLSQQETYSNIEAFSLSACTNLCTYHNECISALNDEETKQCYLFTSVLDVSSSEESTPVTYIENMECSWTHQSMDSCCYFERSLNCIGLTDDTVFTDCQDAFDQGERNSGGTYFLRPEPTWKLIRAVCMFDSQSGWTVIQRRLDGSVDFYRGWDDYVDGFGDLNGEYWIGLDNIYYLTRANQKLSVYLEAHDGESRTANYTFYISGADTDYLSHVSGYVGDAGDSLTSMHNNKRFSTFDNDNDPAGSNCAENSKGGWWYAYCKHSNLNGIWYDGGVVTVSGTGAVWDAWKGQSYSYKTIYMSLGH